MSQPNESSRGSVANLIGRFETHTKRNSLSGSISASSRSSSVVSQTSTNGDTAAAEIREKREWPPKNFGQQQPQQQQDPKPAFVMPSYLRPSVGQLASTVSSSLTSAGSGAAGGPGKSAPSSPPTTSENKGSPSLIQPATPDNQPTPLASVSRSSSRATLNQDQTVKLPVNPVDTSVSESNTPAPEDADPGTPKVGSVSRKASTLTITPADVKPSGKTPVTAKPPPTAKPASTSAGKAPAVQKAPSKAAPAATAKAPAKAPAAAATPKTPAKVAATPKTPAKAPPTASLKTLTSASSMPALRPQHTGGSTSGSTRRPVSRTAAPSTPARAKTPSKPTPASTKSPAVVRAKTPSTGLYAPTAASLARSRTAADTPPVPTPVKKVLSSEAADRLLRPTAASLSKARTAVPAAPSPRPSGVGATPTKKAGASSGTPSKVTPGTPSKGSVKKPSTLSPNSKQGKATGAQPEGEVVAAAGTAAVVAATVAAVAAEEEDQAPEDEEPTAAEPEPVDEASVPEAQPEVEAAVEAKGETNGHAVEPEAKAEEEVEEEEETHESTPEEADQEPASESKSSGNDLEDLVNMLEFKPASASAANTAAISDIPDEE